MPNWPNWPKTHKVAYRRQTNNILLRHVGFIWLVLACCKHTILKKIKISKNIFHFWGKHIKKSQNFSFISFVPLCKLLFRGLSASQEKNEIQNSVNFFCLFGPNSPNWPKNTKWPIDGILITFC